MKIRVACRRFRLTLFVLPEISRTPFLIVSAVSIISFEACMYLISHPNTWKFLTLHQGDRSKQGRDLTVYVLFVSPIFFFYFDILLYESVTSAYRHVATSRVHGCNLPIFAKMHHHCPGCGYHTTGPRASHRRSGVDATRPLECDISKMRMLILRTRD